VAASWLALTNLVDNCANNGHAWAVFFRTLNERTGANGIFHPSTIMLSWISALKKKEGGFFVRSDHQRQISIIRTYCRFMKSALCRPRKTPAS
jgi:hypothetical protein